MKPERWQQVDELLEAALEREARERSAFLKQACDEDEALRQEVESLLQAYERGEDFMEEPALEVAAKRLAEHRAQRFVGRQLGSYQVVAFLDAGAMGEVYRARDTKLEREVAIKVLPDLLARDPERLAGFEREAKLLAAVNHPNIGAIYGLEEDDGLRYLVLELVPGETLAERLGAGALGVKEALRICGQVANALEAAHEKGIIHRDLKPGNIKLDPKNDVKVLDFGIAKSLSDGPSAGEAKPQDGVILGTAAYMSPEQARGKPVDRRADIWSVGCLLYETLTGKRVFERETVADTLTAVLEKEPNWEALPDGTPWSLQSLLRRCLEKDPRRRFHDMADVRIQIEESLDEPTTVSPMEVAVAQPAQWKRALPWSVAAAIAVVAAVAIGSLTRPGPRPLLKFVITPPPTALLADNETIDLAISPDGRRIVFVAERGDSTQLYVRRLDELEAKPIPGTEGAGAFPFFSPDGEWVGFFANGKLKKVSLAGGRPITICDAGSRWSGGAWTPQDTIVFAAASGAPEIQGLYRVPTGGGQSEPLAIPAHEKGVRRYSCPKILPGGKVVLFDAHNEDDTEIWALSLENGQQKILVDEAVNPYYVSTGYLVYQKRPNVLGPSPSAVWAAPFDLAGLEVRGDSVLILEGIRGFDFAASGDGTLVYVPGAPRSQRTLVWVDRDGTQRVVTKSERAYSWPKISPDGKRVAVGIDGDVWIYDTEEDWFRQLTLEGKDNRVPAWTPDGKWVIFSSDRDGPAMNIYRQPADGSGQAERLTTSEFSHWPMSLSPDGSVLAFHELGAKGDFDIGILEMDVDAKPRPLIASPSFERTPSFSPDGQWLAYVSDESGRRHVYVTPYPELDVKWLVSGEQGGRVPSWSPDV